MVRETAGRMSADLTLLGPALAVPFEARAFRDPSVIWLNERWFREAGLRVDREPVRRAVEDWIVRDFAHANPHRLDPAEGYRAATTTLLADRYGLSFGSWHGGSGRCGINGRFIAKGTGRTPLVDPGCRDDDVHASGMMFLSEAIGEAIASEIAAAELPYGAVPVIAIIDAGFSSPVPGQAFQARRAISIRPNFIRPAHFERSIYFGDAGGERSAQFLDAARVRDAVRAIPSLAAGADRGVSGFFEDMMQHAARQAGAAQAHRLWLGAYVSPNRDIHGAIADFGGFRSVPNWRQFSGSRLETFGGEIEVLRGTLSELHFYISKYLPFTPLPDRHALSAALDQACLAGFRDVCGAVLGVDPNSSAVSVLHDYFAHQQAQRQKRCEPADWRRPWLLDAIAPDWRRGSMPGEVERRTARDLLAELRTLGEGQPLRDARVAALKRWLMPRGALLQQIAVSRILRFAQGLSGLAGDDSAAVAAFIDRQIGANRRVWAGMPPTLEVHAQCSSRGSAVLFGFDLERCERGMWVKDDCNLLQLSPQLDDPERAGPGHGTWIPLKSLELVAREVFA